MKEKTKAYVAGILDAEGCLSISESVRPDKSTQYHALVKISNKNKKLMKFIVSSFGGNFKKVPNNDGWIYNWCITNTKHMSKFLLSVRPYLQIKLKEADIILAYCAFNGAQCPDKRKLLYQQIAALKDRSVETITQGFSHKNSLVNAYYGGLMDGEGDLSISLNFPRQRPSPAYYGYARCKNTFKPIIDIMPKLFCAGRLSTIHKNHPIWSPQRIWRLDRRKDLELFLLKILPYLVIKRDQAKLLLNFLRLSNGPQSIKRKQMYEQMQRLNHPKFAENKIESGLTSDCKSGAMGTS